MGRFWVWPRGLDCMARGPILWLSGSQYAVGSILMPRGIHFMAPGAPDKTSRCARFRAGFNPNFGYPQSPIKKHPKPPPNPDPKTPQNPPPAPREGVSNFRGGLTDPRLGLRVQVHHLMTPCCWRNCHLGCTEPKRPPSLHSPGPGQGIKHRREIWPEEPNYIEIQSK